MGLFNRLFGKPVAKPERVTVRERIWRTTSARGRAVAKELAAHLAAGRSVLLLAHFPDTLAALGPALLDANLSREPLPTGLTPKDALRLAGGAPRVLFGLLRDLRTSEFPAPAAAPDSPLPVLLAERHFLRRYDNRAREFAEGLGGRAEVAVHLSLDDHLMKLFAGEWVGDILQRLGLKDDEAIESNMVARRFQQAQDKMLTLVKPEHIPADSPEEWFKLNQKF